MIPRALVLLTLAVFALLLIDDLPPQRTTSELAVKVVAVDRVAGTVTLLMPMVHRVELVGSVEDLDALVKLEVGEFGRGKLVPGRLTTTKRSTVVVRMDKWESEERVVIEQVILK